MGYPAGGALRGVAPGYDLTSGAIGHPQLLWILPLQGDLFFEADVFAPPGEPMYFLINCPVCQSNGRTVGLRVKQDNKPFHYDPQLAPPPFPGWDRKRMRHEIAEVFAKAGRQLPSGLGGTLTVDAPIRCTWEETPELRRSNADVKCPFSVRITNNVVRFEKT